MRKMKKVIFILTLLFPLHFLGPSSLLSAEVQEFMVGVQDNQTIEDWPEGVCKTRYIAAADMYRILVESSRVESVMAGLEKMEQITYIEESSSLKLQGGELAAQWKELIHLPEMSVLSDGQDVQIAVIDTGFDLSNHQLKQSLWTNSGEIPSDEIDNDGNGYPDDMHGWNFSENNNQINDSAGHGTHIASIISNIVPASSVIPIKTTYCDSNDLLNLAAVVEGIYYAVEVGAEIINMSFAGNSYSEALEQAIEYASDSDVKMIAAAGNSGQDQIAFPAVLSEVIAVGSLDKYFQLSDFSAYGPNLDLAALGENILVTGLGGRLELCSGTSYSAAIVSGTSAILMAMNPNLKTSTLRQILLNYSVKINAYSNLVPVLDGVNVVEAASLKFSFSSYNSLFSDTNSPTTVNLYIPPTDTKSKVFISIFKNNRLWWLGVDGTWTDYTQTNVSPLAVLPPLSEPISGTLFGEQGFFPAFECSEFASGSYKWLIALTDQNNRLIAPITSQPYYISSN